jgi:hypothetical protein
MPSPETSWSDLVETSGSAWNVISEETVETSWSDLVETSGSAWGSDAWGLGPLGVFKWTSV